MPSLALRAVLPRLASTRTDLLVVLAALASTTEERHHDSMNAHLPAVHASTTEALLVPLTTCHHLSNLSPPSRQRRRNYLRPSQRPSKKPKRRKRRKRRRRHQPMEERRSEKVDGAKKSKHLVCRRLSRATCPRPSWNHMPSRSDWRRSTGNCEWASMFPKRGIVRLRHRLRTTRMVGERTRGKSATARRCRSSEMSVRSLTFGWRIELIPRTGPDRKGNAKRSHVQASSRLPQHPQDGRSTSGKGVHSRQRVPRD